MYFWQSQPPNFIFGFSMEAYVPPQMPLQLNFQYFPNEYPLNSSFSINNIEQKSHSREEIR